MAKLDRRLENSEYFSHCALAIERNLIIELNELCDTCMKVHCHAKRFLQMVMTSTKQVIDKLHESSKDSHLKYTQTAVKTLKKVTMVLKRASESF